MSFFLLQLGQLRCPGRATWHETSVAGAVGQTRGHPLDHRPSTQSEQARILGVGVHATSNIDSRGVVASDEGSPQAQAAFSRLDRHGDPGTQ